MKKNNLFLTLVTIFIIAIVALAFGAVGCSGGGTGETIEGPVFSCNNDTICDENETFGSCASDCTIETCGNTTCDAEENVTNCPADCPAICGDGLCTHDETNESCPADACPVDVPDPAPAPNPNDTDRPEITSTDPTNDATDIPTTLETITIVFDEPMNRDSIPENPVLLRSDAEGVPSVTGEFTFIDNVTGVFTLNNRLESETTYVIDISGGFMDVSGNTLTENVDARVSYQFITIAHAWGYVYELDMTDEATQAPDVEIDDGENIQAIWVEDEIEGDVTRYGIRSRSYNGITKQWNETIREVETADQNLGNKPRLAINSSGKVAVVWNQYYRTGTPHFAVFSNAKPNIISDWTGINKIDTSVSNALRPNIAYGSRENPVFVWEQKVSADREVSIYGKVGDAATRTIDAADEKASSPHVFTYGDFVQFVWAQNDKILGRSYNADGSWTDVWEVSRDEALLASGGERFTPYSARRQLGGLGSGFSVVWRQERGYTDEYTTLFPNRLRAYIVITGGSSDRVTISESNINEDVIPKVVITHEDRGVFLYTWIDSTGVVRSARYNRTTRIGDTDVSISGEYTGAIGEQQVAINDNGEVVVVWTENTGDDQMILANRFTQNLTIPNSGTWFSEPVRIDLPAHAGNPENPEVSINNNGDAVIVWQQNNNIMASAFK